MHNMSLKIELNPPLFEPKHIVSLKSTNLELYSDSLKSSFKPYALVNQTVEPTLDHLSIR